MKQKWSIIFYRLLRRKSLMGGSLNLLVKMLRTILVASGDSRNIFLSIWKMTTNNMFLRLSRKSMSVESIGRSPGNISSKFNLPIYPKARKDLFLRIKLSLITGKKITGCKLHRLKSRLEMLIDQLRK